MKTANPEAERVVRIAIHQIFGNLSRSDLCYLVDTINAVEHANQQLGLSSQVAANRIFSAAVDRAIANYRPETVERIAGYITGEA